MLDWFWRVVPYPFPSGETEGGGQGLMEKNVVVEDLQSGGGGIDHGVKEAEKMNTGENASEYTEYFLILSITS